MKIENRGDNTSINPHLNRVQEPAERPESKESTLAREATGDRVELSDEAKTMRQARQLLDTLPAVRSEKVAALKPMIQRGVYNVKAQEIAAKMLGQGLFDQLV